MWQREGGRSAAQLEFLLLKADGFSWFIIQASVHLTGSQRWDQFISIERVCVLTGVLRVYGSIVSSN